MTLRGKKIYELGGNDASNKQETLHNMRTTEYGAVQK
jgi:hypothetical protein